MEKEENIFLRRRRKKRKICGEGKISFSGEKKKEEKYLEKSYIFWLRRRGMEKEKEEDIMEKENCCGRDGWALKEVSAYLEIIAKHQLSQLW